MKNALITAAALLVTTLAANAEVVSENVRYDHDGVALEGYLAYDAAEKGRQPAVVVVHEWWGLNDFAKQKARKLAELGYVAFALDMYGVGKVTDSPEQAGQWAGQFRDKPQLWRARARAGYDVVAKHKRVDPDRIAAIGFCFGGSTVQHMAYSGLELKAAVSFHGHLVAPSSEEAGRTKAALLILHGAADSLIAPEDVRTFRDALEQTRIDWHMVTYGDAKHSFMNPAADKLGMDGVGYDKTAARRAWAHMRLFFDEVLASR